MHILQRLNKYLFLPLFLLFIFSFFIRNNLRNVNKVVPELLNQPMQHALDNRGPIEFSKNNYEYHLQPLYGYEINGLIVGKMDYKLFSIYKYDSIFPVDLCLIWGSNVANKVYKDKRIRFSQDCRWCWVEWNGKVDFSLNEMSNNHLLINDKALERKINNLLRGDQIRIKGKLVNVEAKAAGKDSPGGIRWHTSTSRADTGSGSCEVIYVEEIEILKKANLFFDTFFKISSLGLVSLIILNVIDFFFPFDTKINS